MNRSGAAAAGYGIVILPNPPPTPYNLYLPVPCYAEPRYPYPPNCRQLLLPLSQKLLGRTEYDPRTALSMLDNVQLPHIARVETELRRERHRRTKSEGIPIQSRIE